MKKMKSLILTASLVLFLAGFAAAQTDTASHNVTMVVDPIAVIGVAGGNITITVAAPDNGGETPANPTDTTCYVQYTSTVASGLTRIITAEWGAADVAPAGCSLLVLATPSGGTNEGITGGQQTISNSAENVITGIGSCATGTGGTDGAQLTYTLSVDTLTSLVAGESQTATLTYTLLDDA